MFVFCSLGYLIEYAIGDVMENPSLRATADLFHDKWFSIFGPTNELIIDVGPEFHGALLEPCELYCVEPHFAPPDSKWKVGKAECHDGAIVKLMILRVIQEVQATEPGEIRKIVDQVFSAKNSMLRSCGWSQVQALQGRDVVVPSAMLDQIASGLRFQLVCAAQ